MKAQLGEYQSREYFGYLQGNDLTRYPEHTRFMWKCIYEKVEATFTVGLYRKDGVWYVSEGAVR